MGRRIARRDRPAEIVANPLAGLRRRLAAEFGEVLPMPLIERAAEEALAELHEAKIREFVSIFALRHARERLRWESRPIDLEEADQHAHSA